MKRSTAFVYLICFALTRSVIAQSQDKEEQEANPGRPTVSTPATLPLAPRIWVTPVPSEISAPQPICASVKNLDTGSETTRPIG